MAVVLPLTVVVEEVPTEVVAMAAATETHLVLVASHPGGKPKKTPDVSSSAINSWKLPSEDERSGCPIARQPLNGFPVS